MKILTVIFIVIGIFACTNSRKRQVSSFLKDKKGN